MRAIIYILVCFCFNLGAQTFETIDFKNGLSQNTVLSMAQDDDGFVWLGTADGLNRFDGISTKTFRYNSQDKNSICGNEIMDIVNDGHGNLWIATSNCLNKLNLKDYSVSCFKHIPNDSQTISGNYISQIEKVDDQLMLITENALDLIDLKTSAVEKILLPENLIVKNATTIQSESILITTSNGLYIYNAALHQVSPLEEIYNVQYNKENIQRSFLDGNSLFIAYQNKIVRHNLQTKAVQQLFGGNYIVTRDIVKWNDQIWFCTSKGIMTFDCRSFDFRRGLEHGLPIGVSIKSFVRSQNEIWFSVGTGVVKYSNLKGLFHTIKVDKFQSGVNGYNKVWHVCNEGDTIIISTEKGIFFLAHNGDIVPMGKVIPLDKNIQFVSNVSRNKNHIWICTFDAGFYHVDLRTMEVHNYSNTKTGKFYLESNTIRHSFLLEKEVLFSTDLGLFSFDNETHETEKIEYNKDNTGGPLAQKVTFALHDHLGKLWVGTQNGLFRNDFENHFSYYSSQTMPALSNNRVRNIHQQSDSILLIGTSCGLNVFNTDKGTIEYIDNSSGLENDVIYSLEFDDDNEIWVSTNKGISLIKSDNTILNFNINDGLQGSEFNTNASVKSQNGDLYFGGLYGISKFNPLEVKKLKDVQSPLITKLEVLPHEDEKGFELTYPLEKEYEFTYTQCNFIVSFNSINFSNPENTVFFYKLEGYNHEWIKVNGDPEVQFMNLSGGVYDFKVRTTFRNGELSPNITSLKIRINPPFYKSLLFKVLAILLFLIIGFLAYRIRIRSVENRNVKLEEIVNDQTKKLKRAINLQKTFLKEIPEPLVIFNSKNEITLTNDLYKEITSTVSSPHKDKKYLVEQIEESLRLGIEKITKEELSKLDSELSVGGKHFQFKFNRIHTSDKNYGTAVLLRDNTIKKKSEYALQKNEFLFRSYFEKSPIGIIYITDPRKPLSNCNQKFCEILGIEKSIALSKTMMELTYHEDLEKDIKSFKKAMESNVQHLYEPNKRLVSQDGRIILTETYVTFIYNENNELQYMFALMHDVTEQRENQKKLIEARTQLIQSEKLASLGLITAGVAHEINNPVNFIYNGVNNLKTLVNTIKKKSHDDDLETVYEDIQQMIDAVEDGAKRTAEIVKSLRLFTREDTKDLVVYNIISGIESTITLLSYKLKERILIKRNYESSELLIKCYPGQLNQVFMNLILNAIEAIENKGVIEITLEKLEEVLNIIIIDTGTGIDPSISNMVLEPFFSTKGPKDGTGLGLSISNSIIKKHRGSIKFERNSPKGTICTISIPT